MAGNETRIQAAKRRVRTARWAIGIAALVGFGGTVALAQQGGGSVAAGSTSTAAAEDEATLAVADSEPSADDVVVSDDFFGGAQVTADASQSTSAPAAQTSVS